MIRSRYVVFLITRIQALFHVLNFIISRHFLPYGRADLTASAALRPIRGGLPQLHELRPYRYGNLDS
jgi:hypothetical protein